MLPELDEHTGALPLGRFGATVDEIRHDFVDAERFSGSNTRPQIWQDFQSATTGLRSIVPVIGVWVGGSFLTNKLDPDDIDLVYWCQDSLVNQVTDPRDRMLLQMFAFNRVRCETGLRVDTRYCQWNLFAEADHSTSPEHQTYILHRGYWDDFWMRRRTGPKGAAPQLSDALPKRGYFEIELDGFHGV